jgi:hypothetical protein
MKDMQEMSLEELERERLELDVAILRLQLKRERDWEWQLALDVQLLEELGMTREDYARMQCRANVLAGMDRTKGYTNWPLGKELRKEIEAATEEIRNVREQHGVVTGDKP